jgi:hypothetical protein
VLLAFGFSLDRRPGAFIVEAYAASLLGVWGVSQTTLS